MNATHLVNLQSKPSSPEAGHGRVVVVRGRRRDDMHHGPSAYARGEGLSISKPRATLSNGLRQTMPERDRTVATHLVGLGIAAEADGRVRNCAAPDAEASGHRVGGCVGVDAAAAMRGPEVQAARGLGLHAGKLELRHYCYSRCEERVRIHCVHAGERGVSEGISQT